jgi:Tol biopolymer transport system component
MSLVAESAVAITGTDLPPAAQRRSWVSTGGWIAAALLAVTLAAVALMRPSDGASTDPPAVRFQIERADDVYNRTDFGFAVSPDGTMLAYYRAGDSGRPALVVRTLATSETREIPIAAANASPQRNSFFWSPDGRQLVVGAGQGGQVFDLSSGATRELCGCRYVGGTWGRDGTILLGAFGTGTGSEGGLSRLPPGSSTPVPVTTVDASRGERDISPAFFPDGRRFLFTRVSRDGTATYVGSLDGSAPTRIADGSRHLFVPAATGRSAYLLGIEAAGLVAQPFDPDRAQVTGPPVTIVAGAVTASASEGGVLATSGAGTRPLTVPTWFDRVGSARGTVGDPGPLEAIALSSDGRRLAVGVADLGPGGSGSQVWLQDLPSGARTRLTFNRGSTPVWSPDGARLAYTSPRNGLNLPYQKASDGTGEERPLFDYDFHAWTNDWSHDGRWIVFSSPGRTRAGNDLWVVRMDGEGDRQPVPYLNSPALEQQAQFSPDGRFIAYGSDQSGAWEIYVQPFPDASGGKWLVSNGGGVEPRWNRDGTELFYFSGQTLMAVPIRLQPTFSSGAPARLFDAPILPGYTADSHRWQVAPDGRRFLLLATTGRSQGTPLDVVVNWPALLEQ